MFNGFPLVNWLFLNTSSYGKRRPFCRTERQSNRFVSRIDPALRTQSDQQRRKLFSSLRPSSYLLFPWINGSRPKPVLGSRPHSRAKTNTSQFMPSPPLLTRYAYGSSPPAFLLPSDCCLYCRHHCIPDSSTPAAGYIGDGSRLGRTCGYWP